MVLSQMLMLQQQQMALLQGLLGGSPIQAASVASSGGKGKGVKRGPRGSSGFDLFKKQVRKDMKAAATDPEHKFTLAEVAAECARRREAGEYDEAFWKAQATAAKTTTSAAATDDESETSTPSKGPGRPKGSKNKVAAPAAAAPKTAKKVVPPPPVSDSDDDDEEEDDVPASVPWEFKKKQYFKSPTTHEVWDNENGMPSDESIGRWNKATNRIEPL